MVGLVGLGGLALYIDVWLAACLPEIAISEVDASLMRRLGQSLRQVLELQKGETNCLGLHYN